MEGLGRQLLARGESVFLRMRKRLETRPEPVGTFIPAWLTGWKRRQQPKT